MRQKKALSLFCAAVMCCSGGLVHNSVRQLCQPMAVSAVSEPCYLDAEGTLCTCTSQELVMLTSQSELSDLRSGWYCVEGKVTVDTVITISGEVHLILSDGCELLANSGINVSDGNSLTIYAQSTGADAGVLTATGGTRQAGIGGGNRAACGTVTINGGHIHAAGGSGAAGIGGGSRGAAGTIIINRAEVSAQGGAGAPCGIGCGSNASGGSITIRYSTVTSRITDSSGDDLGVDKLGNLETDPCGGVARKDILILDSSVNAAEEASEPAYTVTIPSSVTLNGDDRSCLVSAVYDIGDKVLRVTMRTDLTMTEVTDAEVTADYTVRKDGVLLSPDASVLNVTGAGTAEAELVFSPDESTVQYAGNYQDTMTFEITLT